MKKILTIVTIIAIVIFAGCMIDESHAYTPSELDFEWNKWDTYYDMTKKASFDAANFYDAWDKATGKWIKVAVIDSFENNYYHWVWIESLITADHNDWGIVWYAPDAEVIRYNYCSGFSCRHNELIWILDEIKTRWDIKVINLSVSWRNKEYSAKLKELTEAGIMVVSTLHNKEYLTNSFHCEDDSIICVWNYLYNKNTKVIKNWERFYNSTEHINVLGNGYYPEMDDGNWGTHRKVWTSFAAPQVASVIAMMLEIDPTLTYAEIRDKLISTWTKVSNWDVALNASAALDSLWDMKMWWDQSTTEDNQEVVQPIETKPVVIVPTPKPVVIVPTPKPVQPTVDMELATRIIKLEKRLTDQNTEMIKIKEQLRKQEERLTWVENIINKLKSIFY